MPTNWPRPNLFSKPQVGGKRTYAAAFTKGCNAQDRPLRSPKRFARFEGTSGHVPDATKL
jgi:hypothetical protein